MKKQSFGTIVEGRIVMVLLFFLLALGLLLGRLFTLQIVHYNDYVLLTSRQHNISGNLFSERGLIYAQDKEHNLIPLTLNKLQKTLIASPKDAVNPEDTAMVLARELRLDREAILKKLSKAEDPHEILAKNIELGDAGRVENLKLKGIFFEEERHRVYPHETLGAHIVGFVSKEEDNETGKYGLERTYNEKLAGAKGFFEGAKDAAGFWIALGRRVIHPPQNGSHVLLSVDYNIQRKAEEVLAKAKEKWKATSGAVLILEPKTGRILALAGNRAFDPNKFSQEKDFSVFLNPIVESTYELGSVMKPITMASGVEAGLVKPETTYTDTGEVKIKGYKIQNFDLKAHGIQTMTQVLQNSLNTGAVFVSRILGKERQLAYLKKFGFGEKTGIDLPGEVSGNISNLRAGREIDFATASFGQGIAITPLQLAMAVGAIANGGKLMRPSLVDKIVDDSGNETITQPEVRREVISKETAETLSKMLVAVVRGPFDSPAGITGYFIAGKTGTAQIPRRDGKGYSDKVIHTFVGYAPAFDPKFLVLLQLNEPQGNRFAANTLTPPFRDIAEYILNYYQIPPDEK